MCGICMDVYIDNDMVAHLECDHTFHVLCLDTWVATAMETNRTSACPYCRAPISVTRTAPWEEPTPPATPRREPRGEAVPTGTPSSAASYNTAASAADNPVAFPAWPVITEHDAAQAFLSNTTLADGRLSFIVDPGAWTSLVGKLLARQMCSAPSSPDTRHRRRSLQLH